MSTTGTGTFCLYFRLAAVTIAWVLDHFVWEIILAAAFGGSRIVRMRGGYYYDVRLGMAHYAIADL